MGTSSLMLAMGLSWDECLGRGPWWAGKLGVAPPQWSATHFHPVTSGVVTPPRLGPGWRGRTQDTWGPPSLPTEDLALILRSPILLRLQRNLKTLFPEKSHGQFCR